MATRYLVPTFLVVTAQSDLDAADKLSSLKAIAMKHGFWLYQDELIHPKQVEDSHQEQSFRSMLDVINLEEILTPLQDPEVAAFEARLLNAGYKVGLRDAKVKPQFAGAFMVWDPEDSDVEAYAIVGDDRAELIREAHAHIFESLAVPEADQVPQSGYVVSFEAAGHTNDSDVIGSGLSEEDAVQFTKLAVTESGLPPGVKAVVRGFITDDDSQETTDIHVFIHLDLLVDSVSLSQAEATRPPIQLLNQLAQRMMGNNSIEYDQNAWEVTQVTTQ